MAEAPGFGRRAHRILGALVVAQLVVWLVTGLMFHGAKTRGPAIASQIADERAALATSESQLLAHRAELERLRLALAQAESRAKAADQAFQTARDRERQLRDEVVAAAEARRLARESLAEAEARVFTITTQVSIAEDELEQIPATGLASLGLPSFGFRFTNGAGTALRRAWAAAS